MGWIYAQASEGLHNPSSPWSAPWPTVNETDHVSASFFPECIEEKLIEPPSGMTLPLFEDECSRRLISSPQGFHARTSALREIAKAWAVSEAGFFGTLFDLPKKQKLRLFSSKTLRAFGSSFRPSEMRLKILDIQSGTVSLRPETSELDTDESDGSRWPTPIASRAQWQKQRDGSKRLNLPALWRLGKLPTLCAREYRNAPAVVRPEMGARNRSVSTYWKATTGTNMPPSFLEWIMGYRIGATASEPWATEWYLNKRRKRLKGSAA